MQPLAGVVDPLVVSVVEAIDRQSASYSLVSPIVALVFNTVDLVLRP